MSLYIKCDYIGCDSIRGVFGFVSSDELNYCAKRFGWECTENGRNFCPEHTDEALGHKPFVALGEKGN